MNIKAIRLTFPMPTVILTLVLALFSSFAHASVVPNGDKAVIDEDGRILRLHNGTFGELFPDTPGVGAENPVLALEVIQPDGTSILKLVPGTETLDVEDWETLIYEPNSKTTYLLWQDLYSHLHPRLLLTSFRDNEWQEVIQIWSSPFDHKGSPGLAVTREATTAQKPGSNALLDRTIVHLTWWQDAPATSRKLYAPVIIEDGQYIGWTPVIDLANFLPIEDGHSPADVAAGMANAVKVERGADNHSIVIGFLHPDSHRLITLEVDVLPQALSDLANKARAQIIEMGAFARSMIELSDQIHAMILSAGVDFHTASLEFMANRVRDEVGKSRRGRVDLDEVAKKARAQIIEMGARMALRGLADARNSFILEVGETASGEPAHDFKVTILSNREAPSVTGPAEIYLSEAGDDLLVVWEDPEHNRIFYQVSRDDGWSDVASVEPTETLDREAIHRLLQERLR